MGSRCLHTFNNPCLHLVPDKHFDIGEYVKPAHAGQDRLTNSEDCAETLKKTSMIRCVDLNGFNFLRRAKNMGGDARAQVRSKKAPVARAVCETCSGPEEDVLAIVAQGVYSSEHRIYNGNLGPSQGHKTNVISRIQAKYKRNTRNSGQCLRKKNLANRDPSSNFQPPAL